jgi:putative redox protein
MTVDAKVVWKGRMSFDGSAESGFHIPLGTDSDVGGDNDGLRPMELIAVGLAGCTAMDVISILRKKKQDVTAFEVKVRTEEAEAHPKVFTRAAITYEVTGRGVEETALRRAIELSARRYCPAQAMLGKVMPIRLSYSIYEASELGAPSLTVSGEWLPAEGAE